MDVDANLRFNPVNGSIIVPSTEGSPLYALISLVATGSASSAQQRLDQVLSQTNTSRVPNMHLSGLGAAKGDRGFRREFADDYLYGELWGYGPGAHSNQVGHLLTAIATSYGGGTEFWMRLDIGHEKINDGRTVGSRGWKILPQYGAATSSDLQLFSGALSADAQGDYAQRDANLSAILAWDTTYGPQFSRIGNSMEDLRLTVRGWNLGQLVLSGALRTNRDLAAWIALNVAE
jgi:hypothetical protein